jgi:hypothetical protein
MRGRATPLFALLILAQAAHSAEEQFFRLYEVLAPARFLSGLISRDLATGFALANVAIVSFGVWGHLARVRPKHRAWRAWAWFWVYVEGINGANHVLFALFQGSYFPGLWTAPLLLALAAALGVTLTRETAPGAAGS